MTPQEFYLAELVFFAVETILLGVIIWQGYALLQNDREKLELDREQHRMAKERYDERATWRKQKRQQQLKRSEPSSSDARSTVLPLPPTTPSEKPKDGAVESAADIKASSVSL
jgi:hypothetical protein